jgi:homoserine kinase type II
LAVYTALERADIEEFLSQYNVGSLTLFEGIAQGVTNTNYLLSVRGTNYILTLFENHVKLEELPYFVAVMEWWSARGMVCPQPIKMNDGRALGVIKERAALMVSFLEGSGVETITLDHMPQLGKLVADMHVAGMDFPHQRPNPLSVKGWESIIDIIIDRVDEIESGLRTLINEEYNYLSEHWPQGLPSGPVHADLFPDNVFFEKTFGKKPILSGVIDFYFTCHDAWAYDLAICVNAWCFDHRHRFIPERAQALMQSYTDQRPLTQEEEASFSLLLRGAALRFLLTRAHDWLIRPEGAIVTPKDPLEYATKLRFFQQNHL